MVSKVGTEIKYLALAHKACDKNISFIEWHHLFQKMKMFNSTFTIQLRNLFLASQYLKGLYTYLYFYALD